MDVIFWLLSPFGRIGRTNWWLAHAVYLVIGVALIFMLAPAFKNRGWDAESFTNLVLLILAYPGIVISIKRWHDRDKSGWWVLITLIPLVGGLWALVELGFLPGTEGSNRFGDDPRLS